MNFIKQLGFFRTGLLSATGCFMAYPFVKTDTKFYYQQTDFNKRLLAKSDSFLHAYMPGFAISGKVRQCLFNIWFATDIVTPMHYERTYLTMKDGGTISIDWAKADANRAELIEPTLTRQSQTNKKRQVCVIFPGLSGGSDRGYVKALVKTLLSDGFEVAVFHNRGVCNTPYTSMGFADLSSTEELERALEFVKEQAGPDADLVGIGLSMGANLMTRIAGIQCEKGIFPLKALCAVNNPFDLWLAINLMRGNAYEKNLAKELRRNLIAPDHSQMSDAEKDQFSKMVAHWKLDLNKISKLETWRDLDEFFTIKVHPRFKSVIGYYNESSCLDWVEHISVPTLVLHSEDDPIVPVDCVPLDECQHNPNLITALTRRGSHVCYFMGTGKRRWYTHACSEFLQNALELLNEKEAVETAKEQVKVSLMPNSTAEIVTKTASQIV